MQNPPLKSPAFFIHDLRIRLHDTDAAGVLFYGHLFRHAHDAYESFMEHIGFALPALIGTGPAPLLPLPIIQAQARYQRPLRHGEAVRIELRVAEVRDRSFALDYRFFDTQGRACATASTVHCLADAQRVLPEELRRALTARIADLESEKRFSSGSSRQ